MDVWRITAWPGLSGAGGLSGSGRWSNVGRPVIYTSEHPALAMVEVLAHLELDVEHIPLGLKLIRITVAADAMISPMPRLSKGWQDNEPGTRETGDKWLESAAGLLLPVPSAILAHATNYLVNPAFADAAAFLTEHEPEPFWFDKRFIR